VGSDEHNQALSQRRAESVRRWLVEREGIPAAGLTVRGFGESQPVASNDTEEGRQRNRRVRAVIRKTPPT
jgi:OOP family OmpA-OmpF porin